MELFVGNLAPETTDAELTAAFKGPMAKSAR
jgi:RNA recognition motif-containing protein